MTLPCANADPPPNVAATATIIDSATLTNVARFIAVLLIKKIYPLLDFPGFPIEDRFFQVFS
jgi:hypothetical protein